MTALTCLAAGPQLRARVKCSAAPQQRSHNAAPGVVQHSRRSLLALVPFVAVATVDTREASAAWDGESAAQGSCALGEAGADCRQAILLEDSKNLESYESAADNSKKAGRAAGSVAVVDEKYTKDTQAMSDKLRQYLTIDPYDPERGPLIKTLKTEGSAWVSKYAKGGSVRTLSGRKLYIVIDSVQGHLASNGFGVLPGSKARKLLQDLDDTDALLASGK